MYGCYDRPPFVESIKYKDSFLIDGPVVIAHVMRDTPNPNTKDCQYTKSEEGIKDPKCVGCKWKLPIGTTPLA